MNTCRSRSPRTGLRPGQLLGVLATAAAQGLWSPAAGAQSGPFARSGVDCMPTGASTESNFTRGPYGISNATTVSQYVVCGIPLTPTASYARLSVDLHGEPGSSAQCQIAWTHSVPGAVLPTVSTWTSPLVMFTSTTRLQRINYVQAVIVLYPPGDAGVLTCRLGRYVRLVSYVYSGSRTAL